MGELEQIGRLVKAHALNPGLKDGALVARGLEEIARLEFDPGLKRLVDQLGNPAGWNQRVEAWQQLREMDPETPGWQISLRELIRGGDGWAQIFAAESLAWHGIGAPEAIPVLVATLDATLDLRRYQWARVACGAIGRYSGLPRPLSLLALPVLLRALGAGDHNVRGYAALALGGLGPVSRSALVRIGDLLDRSENPLSACYLEALKKIDPAIESPMDAWVRALDHEEASIRAEAVSSIGSKGNGASEAVPDLLRLSGDFSALVRKVVALALARIEVAGDHIIPPLENLNDDDDPEVRLAASYALLKQGVLPKEHQKKLRSGLKSPDPSHRLLAAWALGNSGEAGHLLAAMALRKSLRLEHDPQVRSAIEQALLELKHPTDA